MRFVGLFLIMASLPAFIWLLQSRRAQRWAILALGALPLLQEPLNLNAALISWAAWPGHTKGLILTPLDALALASCLHFRRAGKVPLLLWPFVIYLVCLIPGLFAGALFQPAFFFFFQTLRVVLLFLACYLVVLDGQLANLARGIAVAVILNALVAVSQALGGASQAPGLLGHQNLTGMATNLCLPLLLVLGLRRRGGLFLIAAGAAGISALVGGSRATIVLYAVGVAITLIGSSLSMPSGRKNIVTGIAFLALAAAAPLAVHKLNERADLFSPDLERVAFERAAHMMISDHPWGVGINQYVVVANSEGYMTRAGVRWGAGARSTNVHNFYLLARTEGGLAELFGVLVWLIWPIVVGLILAVRRKAPARDISVAMASALIVTAFHNRVEWIFVTAVPQYLTALMIGILAAIQVAARGVESARRHAPSPANPVETFVGAAPPAVVDRDYRSKSQSVS